MNRFLGFTLLFALAAATAGADRWYGPQHAAAGRPLYVEHCAACHGLQAEGAPQWHRLNPDGSNPPPPLNGTGHAWHHPLKGLHATISQGQGNMPGWGGRLQTGEILAIIAWFQSQWSDEIYAAWARTDRGAQ